MNNYPSRITHFKRNPREIGFVAGRIRDVGAALSHAAIVARELGIPAVVSCGIATTV
jgi:phosphoenolpyruvate-protein kinase (PTS system EI component)